MDERYPIGHFEHKGAVSQKDREFWLSQIEELPRQFRDVIEKLDEVQLATPYREGGWTVRQVVHHVADSHMNSFIRFKLALTEDKPTIKPYQEAEWAKQGDYRLPVEVSLATIDSIHKRTVALLENLSTVEYERSFFHPESGELTLATYTGMIAWHGRHHLAHITQLIEKKGW
ncbi:YfiT family bacillithiol transferase [Radiobacillus deserti]|uniref:Putative metal-dependent hydrolase FN924_01310 n=1 Tax=Radiobacillus deserti TaxID=2594883 RepID=A0A516KC41_9BACI|nr:putative metal-dependent hydrolase [Radiobacillus deserti]QDP38971.1 putative metal-dependent hydrolase [Radiobacillus deserti]